MTMDEISLDDWELLPDDSSYFMEEYTSDDEDAKKLLAQAACVQDHAMDFKDIGVVTRIESRRGDFISEATEMMMISQAEEEEMAKCLARAKEAREVEVMVEAAPDPCDEEEGGVKKDTFSAGKLTVNGVGALCSFGVAAATFCIFLLGGRQQHQQQKIKQNQSTHLHMHADDDESIQKVMQQQQASRLNHAMSSVMGGGASARASISFGGYYNGF